VTQKEFAEYQEKIKAEFTEVKQSFKRAEKQSHRLIAKIDQVDWSVIN
jgi:predicted  nucleic acid-binding Zn-ribbon protein